MKNILKGLVGTAFLVSSLALPQLPMIYKMFDAEDKREKERVRKAMDRLQIKNM